jgi:hypothetical protein
MILNDSFSDACLNVLLSWSAVVHVVGLNIRRRLTNKDMFTFLLQRVAGYGY